ncbi:transcription initiation factor TFIID subunit 12 isoform X1 [Morus notabilis]|uniref:transcription initiation factor TFIID subunit 12 isoform X1 n=1 Tax=Morus notabilis TaxID=981085 RepID=UPI000CED7E74|nr:transcription initiation factor TFIID subunit 12 isoform X1 [Morus notabilis]
MDQQNPAPPPPIATSAAVSAAPTAPQLQPQPQPPPPKPQPQPQPQPSPSSSATATPSSILTPLPPSSNPNPVPNQNPNPRPPTPLPLQHSQSLPPPSRPPATLTRPWQPSHLAPSSASAGISPSSSSLSSSALPPTSAPPPRGGVAIGVPAHRPSPSPSQPAPFSASYGHFGGLGRSGVGLPESSPNSNASQVRPSMQGIGMLGSLSSGAQMRPGGIPPHHQQRPVQPSLRPVSSPSNQLPSSQQNYQAHSLLRVPSAGSPGSPSPSMSQSVQSLNQPWLASGSQGKPPLPSPSYRQPMNPQSLQQRSHMQTQPQQQMQPQLQPQSQLQPQPQQQQQQQQNHQLPMTAQQHMSALQQQQQQPSPSQQAHEHYGKQVPSSRVPQALSHQQQITRVQASGNQKSSTPASVQPNTVQSVPQNRISTAETDESCNRILSKRSIHELVSQVDPSEKLDPEVEDILMDIADDFVESITTFGCSLAKHRKSTTLEAKDILLHLERNWNITLPGFGGDEIKSFRKPVVNDIHMERLVAIKKSMLTTETANTRNPSGQAAGNAKGSLVKTPANIKGSPNVKI